MAWVKLYKIIADSPVGFQTFNEAGANLAEVRTQMFVGHGKNETGLYDYSRLGRHDLHEVSRTIGNAFFSTPTVAPTETLGWCGIGIPWLDRVSAGVYYMPVIGLSQWDVGGATYSSSGTYLPPQIRSVYYGSSSGTSGIWVRTLALSGGDFVATDASFTFALYGVV